MCSVGTAVRAVWYVCVGGIAAHALFPEERKKIKKIRAEEVHIIKVCGAELCGRYVVVTASSYG